MKILYHRSIISVMLELTILIVSAALNLVFALVVLAKNYEGKVNRSFAFLAISLVVWMIVNYISVHPFFVGQLWWIRIVMMTAAVMSMAIFTLTDVFPTGQSYYPRVRRFVITLGIVVAFLALSPYVFTRLDIVNGGAQPIPGVGMVVFMPYAVGTLLGSAYVLMRKFLTLRGTPKEHVRYALIGLISTFSLLAFFNFIVIILFHNTSFIIFSPAVTLIFTTSFAYGMVRYKLFDIRLIITRFVAYLLLSVVAGMAYGLSAAGLSYLIAGYYPNTTQVVISAVVIGVLILFVDPLRQFFNYITRKVFYQDDYDTKNVLDEIASILVRATETKALVVGSTKVIKAALKPEFVTLLLIEDKEEGGEERVQLGHTLTGLKELSSVQLHYHIKDVVTVDSSEAKDDFFHAAMKSMGVSVAVRLETKDEVVGFAFLGYKTTGSAYTQRDVDLIRIVGDELAVAIQNTMRFEQIRDFNATLRQRIEDATKELRASNEQLHRLDAAKDEFVSMASHQLRTPLTSVKGYISMVLEGDAGKISAMQRQLLGEAFTSSERMVHLINDFLNVSRLQTGKFVIEAKPTNLAKVAAEEVESLQTTANAHDLLIQYRAPSVFPTLYIDEGKIRQVIMNFIDNAIYYSHEHTTIYVELTTEDGDAVLRVRDTGIGVPKTEQAHLFTKFFRATNARKQRPDGTGVGLFLTKKVIVAHGGTIVFESIEGEGSTFGFRLPIKLLSAAPAENPEKLK